MATNFVSCYTNSLSCHPGERFTLHASASDGPCTLAIARVGRSLEVVLRRDGLVVGEHPVPARADREGCGWPAVTEIEVGDDWSSGYYDIALTDAAGKTAHHFVCIKPPRGKRRARAAFVLATNTYQAYNWWGGANAYGDVKGLMSGEVGFEDFAAGATGTLSTERPFPPLIVAPPPDIPRAVSPHRRGFRERPFAGHTAWTKQHRATPFSFSAGFLHKWEHLFAAWAEEEGLALDYFTDHDLDAEAGVLDGYDALVIVGHSEYWSGPQRTRIEEFVDRGGKLALFSANTCFWKVRWEDDGRTMICHKVRGFEAEPEAGPDGTHLWSHPAFGNPEAAITGLTFLFGGYHRVGMCTARGPGGYTIYDDRHWALEGTDLFYGDTIGMDLPLIGYENDGCRFEFGDDGLPKAIPTVGVPDNLEIIGFAPCSIAEEPGRGYPPIVPPERLDLCAEIAFGDGGEAAQARLRRGHAVLASFRRGAGEVFNGGTTEWAHGLAAKDPFVTRITRNVLERFGASGGAGAG